MDNLPKRAHVVATHGGATVLHSHLQILETMAKLDTAHVGATHGRATVLHSHLQLLAAMAKLDTTAVPKSASEEKEPDLQWRRMQKMSRARPSNTDKTMDLRKASSPPIVSAKTLAKQRIEE